VEAGLKQPWSGVPSESPDLDTGRFAAPDAVDRQAFLVHLWRLAGEPGWSKGTRRRTAFALAEWEQRGNELEATKPRLSH
jgi:hypothetical protein